MEKNTNMLSVFSSYCFPLD